MSHKPILIRVDREKDPDKWHEIRRTGMGGSDVAAACGLNPWRGPLALYLEKVGQAPEREPSEAMEIGSEIEDFIARRFATKTGLKIRRVNAVLRHPTYPFMIANIDRSVDEDGEPGVLEVKNVGEYMAADWEDGRVPDYYMVQLQWYLEIRDNQYGWIVPLIGGNKMRPVRVERNQQMIDMLIKIAGDFWKYVETRTPPPIDSSEQATQVLRYCYPESSPGKTMVMDEEQQALFKNLLQAREALRLITEEVNGYKNQLMEWMKDAEAAYLPGGEKPALTYKGHLTRRLDGKSMALAHPDIAANYYVESSSRSFRVGKGDE